MAEPTRTNNEITAAQVQARIRRAISCMPYGGLVHPQYPRDPAHPHREADIDLEWIAGYLEKLRAVLESCSAHNQEDETELRELRTAQTTIRRFLGLEAVGLDVLAIREGVARGTKLRVAWQDCGEVCTGEDRTHDTDCRCAHDGVVKLGATEAAPPSKKRPAKKRSK